MGFRVQVQIHQVVPSLHLSPNKEIYPKWMKPRHIQQVSILTGTESKGIIATLERTPNPSGKRWKVRVDEEASKALTDL